MSKKIRIGLVSRTLTLRDEVPTYQKAPYVPRDIVTILGELSALPIVFPDVEGASGKDYVDLAGEMPTQNAAVLRLLLAVRRVPLRPADKKRGGGRRAAVFNPSFLIR